MKPSSLRLTCVLLRHNHRHPATMPSVMESTETDLTPADIVATLRREISLVVSESYLVAALRYRPCLTWAVKRGNYTTAMTVRAAQPQCAPASPSDSRLSALAA